MRDRQKRHAGPFGSSLSSPPHTRAAGPSTGQRCGNRAPFESHAGHGACTRSKGQGQGVGRRRERSPCDRGDDDGVPGPPLRPPAPATAVCVPHSGDRAPPWIPSPAATGPSPRVRGAGHCLAGASLMGGPFPRVRVHIQSGPRRSIPACLGHRDPHPGFPGPRGRSAYRQVAASGSMPWARALASTTVRNHAARPGRTPS